MAFATTSLQGRSDEQRYWDLQLGDDRELAIGGVRVRVAEGIELLDAREVGRVEAASVRVDVDDGQDEHALGRCGGRTPGELGTADPPGGTGCSTAPPIGFASIRSAANASS
jgi:hypothetical protein